MEQLIKIGDNAVKARVLVSKLSSNNKNKLLSLSAQRLMEASEYILAENAKDIKAAIDSGISGALIDRLTLNQKRIDGMADGLKQVAFLEDPIGEAISMKKRPNGLKIAQLRVPIGVIGIIYEARPNVTVDAFALCFKSGNVVILRGGKEAINSNKAIVSVFRKTLTECRLPIDAIQLIENTERQSAVELMKMNKHLDLLIPRGGAGLIKSVVENSTVPVIETGVGNCHIYVHSQTDEQKAINIVFNAKTHRPGVCNAAESLLIDRSVAESMLPKICKKLQEKNVEIRGDAEVCKIITYAKPATDEDWGTEYLDYIISAKVVSGVEEAITHIDRFGTKHSEAIVTENYTVAQKFLDEVDAAAVYVNASTRFTDGEQFGFGAEIGISTQKIHARGPMGLNELTTTKFVIYGDGQIRE